MWVGWDLTVFQGFFKASGEKASLQEAFLGSTGGDELGTGCFGGTSHPRERSVGEREACPTKSPSCLHGVGAVTGSKWESGRVRGEGGGDAARACSPCWALWGHGWKDWNDSPLLPVDGVWASMPGVGSLSGD